MRDYHHRRLNPGQSYKPLDFGNGLLAGSVSSDGRLLSIGTYHAKHGYLTLAGWPDFPEQRRHDGLAVREYRAQMAADRSGLMGLRLPKTARIKSVELIEDVVPTSTLIDDDVEARVWTWAPRLEGRPIPVAMQLWRVKNRRATPVEWTFSWEGTVNLGRSSYTQLTERGDLQTLPGRVKVGYRAGEMVVSAPGADAAAVMMGLPKDSDFERQSDSLVRVRLAEQLLLNGQEVRDLRLIVALGSSSLEALDHAHRAEQLDTHESLYAEIETWHELWEKDQRESPNGAELLVHRAISYVLSCCALPVQDRLCLITDHQILPMSWTRDSYFMIQALQVSGAEDALQSARRHLDWLFENALQPDGSWGRATLANGIPKGETYQLDQQCYPLLEAAEYFIASQDTEMWSRVSPKVRMVLDRILTMKAARAALFRSDETPADDPLELPYHFSSQVLLWHTLRVLHGLNASHPFTRLDLDQLAEELRQNVLDHFVAEFRGRRLFAYAIDLRESVRFYHDANDMPTVLAPIWGFCSVNDPVWRATMEFGFSEANAGGYYQGQFGGLGSVHTPGPWPLGDVQEMLYTRLRGDSQASELALARLINTSCWDGALPEARDEMDGSVRSRHWFAWPGAALTAALLHPGWADAA